jgi:hypothetical protein
MKKMMQVCRKIGERMSMGKKLLIVLLSMGLALGASAQHGHVIVRGGYYYHPNVVIGAGFGYPGFYPYGPYGFYSPWGYPYPPYYYGRGVMPTKLGMQIEDIKNDYQDQIKAVRHDKTLAHHDKRERIKQLKQDRDAAIVQARKDYYNNSRRNYNQRNNGNDQNGNNQPGNGQQQPGKNAPSNNEDQPEYHDKSASTTGS